MDTQKSRLTHSGQIVRKARQHKNLTLEGVAGTIGKSYSLLTLWELGKREPSDQVAAKVCEVLGLDFDKVKKALEADRLRKKIGSIETEYGVKLGVRHWELLDAGVESDALTEDILNDLLAKGAAGDDVIRVGGCVPTVFEGSLGEQVSLVVIPVLGQVPAGDPVRITPEVAGLAESYESIDKSRISQVDRVFGLRVTGDSMVERGISPGDVVVVDTGVVPQSGDIAVVTLEGEAAVKEIYHTKDGIMLVSAHPRIPKQTITDPDKAGLRVVGRVIKVVKNT